MTFPLRIGEKKITIYRKSNEKRKSKRSVGSVGGLDPEHHEQPGPLPPRTITATTTASAAAARQRSSPTDLTIQARLCACACVSRLAPHSTLPNRACARARTHTPSYIIKLCAPTATGHGFHIDTKHRHRTTTTTTLVLQPFTHTHTNTHPRCSAQKF